MILHYSKNGLTRFAIANGYSTSTSIPVTANLETVLSGLMSWLASQLATNETVAQVLLEETGQAPVAFIASQETVTNSDGTSSVISVQTPTAWTSVISAAVTAQAAAGERTISISSLTLPSDLQSELLAAWASVAAL